MRSASPNASTVLSLILSACILAATTLVSAREWADATGRFQVEAEFAGEEHGQVRLKKPDGQTVQVPLSRLSQADQDYVRQRAAQPLAPPKPAAAPDPVAGAPPILHTLGGHRGTIRGLVFTPDGQKLVSTSADEHFVRLWDAAQGTQLRTFQHRHDKTAWTLAISPDGHYLAAGCDRAFIVCWSLTTGSLVFNDVMAGKLLMAGPAFTSDSKCLVLSCADVAPDAGGGHPGIQVWGLPSGKQMAAIPIRDPELEGIGQPAPSPDGRFIAVATSRIVDATRTPTGSVGGAPACVIRILFLKSNRETNRLLLKDEDEWSIPGLRYSPDSKEVIFGGTLPRRWNPLRREPTPLLDATHHKGPVALAADSNVQTLASYDTHGTICIWDLGTQRLLRKWKTDIVRPLCALNGSGTLLAVTGDGRDAIQVYDLSNK